MTKNLAGSSVTSQAYWDEYYEKMPLEYYPEFMLYKDLFDKYSKKGGTAFEVGCYPGSFMVYLAKQFGYKVSGIDATPFVKNRLPAFLSDVGVVADDIICDDFLEYNVGKTFDLVYSMGFIEHFRNYDEVIRKHVQLVNDGGILIITCPNFRGFQYVLHRLLDAPNLRRHYLPAMNFRKWRHILENNGMEILHEGYYRTAGFWADQSKYKLVNGLTRCVRRLLWKLDSFIDIPNPLISPCIVSISRKTGNNK
ncbi:MAG: class I SAM-dependent methyltransferase [Nitrospirae bacterium]|nr:class I SAM-dependent methyltransferase [Nitrospirota bacterium]